jgi:hypothetical protein
VSELTWRRRIAGRRIGEGPSLRLNGREHTVIGVLSAGWRWGDIPVQQDVHARAGGATAWIFLRARSR